MMIITGLHHRTGRSERIHRRTALQILRIVPVVQEAALAAAVDPDPTGDDKILLFNSGGRGIFREPIECTVT